MRIGVIHNTLNSCGGGERVCLTVIEALKEAGHHVILATFEPTDWSKISRIMGGYVKPDEEISLFRYKIQKFGIYMRLLTFLLARRLSKEVDILINTHGDVLPIPANIVYVQSYLIYIHYPTFAILKETPVNIKYSTSLFWRFYFTPYEVMNRINTWLFSKSKIMLTNSNFSRGMVEKYLNRKSIVLYPPVEIEEFRADKIDEREDIAVTCGRFTPEKNYEFVLKVAEKLPEIQFIIIGSTSGRISEKYLRKLMEIKRVRKLDNVKFLRDYPRKLQIELYKRAKIYLHSMIGEHFGISIVEAMASGLIPIVHKSGGAWIDIVEEGKYGFGYTTLSEAASSIKKAIKCRRKIATKIIRQAEKFSKEKFKKRFMKIIEYLTFT